MENNDFDDKDSVIIDIPMDLEAKQWSKCWIHRVPRKLRKENETAYTPQLVSIGPFHHQKHELQAMESLKDKYYHAFCNRVKTNNNDDHDDDKNPFEKFVKYIEKNHSEIRSRYAGSTIDDESFDDIILKDACFIIELFLRNNSNQESSEDYILSTPWLKKAIKLDLILLENQIPFYVLAQLYGFFVASQKTPSPTYYDYSTTKSGDSNFCALLKLTCLFFKDHALCESEHNQKFKDVTKIKHFTDLLREFWLPANLVKEEKSNKDEEELFSEHKYLYCATKLDTAGVVFARAKKDTCLTEIELSRTPFLGFFPGMTLKLPELKIENDTECLLQNVMALEQCLYAAKEDYICSYVALMDQLINTSEDVDFLVEKKIITNLLGSNKEAAMLFNGLCCQIPRDKCCYASYFNELNKFYENRWNVYKATLKKVYFKDLWTSSSTVVGIFVLLFTISATTRNVLR